MIKASICILVAGDIAKAVVENEKCKIKFRSTAPSSTQVSYRCTIKMTGS